MSIRDLSWLPAFLRGERTDNILLLPPDYENDDGSIQTLEPVSFASGSIDALVRQVYKIVGPPVAGYAVTALLESRGWTNYDAMAYFSVSELTELGEMVWSHFWQEKKFVDFRRGDAQVNIASTPLHGFYFLLLALLQFVGLGVAGVALGVGRGFSSAQMLSVGVGLLLGFVWANGFTQLLARDPLSIHLEGNDVTAGRLALRVLGMAAAALLLLDFFIALIVLLVAPAWLGLVVWGMGYCFGIAFFWLLVNVLFIFDLAPWTLLATLLAFICMALGFRSGICQQNPLICPFAGILLADFFLAFVSFWWWFSRMRSSSDRQVLPRWQLVLVNQSGYLFYGFGLMSLVVIDRFIAWWVSYQTTGQPKLMYYEVGLGWALLAFLVLIAVQERLLRNFLHQLQTWSQSYDLKDALIFTKQFQRAYWKNLSVIILTAVAVVVTLWLVLAYLERSSDALRLLLPRGEGWLVFRWGLLGYGLLAVAMLNLGLIIITAQPAKTLPLLLVAIVIDVAVAWLSAHSFGYGASVAGLVVASGVLLLLSTFQVRFLLRSATYLFYSAG
jgi:hypothetical protein